MLRLLEGCERVHCRTFHDHDTFDENLDRIMQTQSANELLFAADNFSPDLSRDTLAEFDGLLTESRFSPFCKHNSNTGLLVRLQLADRLELTAHIVLHDRLTDLHLYVRAFGHMIADATRRPAMHRDMIDRALEKLLRSIATSREFARLSARVLVDGGNPTIHKLTRCILLYNAYHLFLIAVEYFIGMLRTIEIPDRCRLVTELVDLAIHRNGHEYYVNQLVRAGQRADIPIELLCNHLVKQIPFRKEITGSPNEPAWSVLYGFVILERRREARRTLIKLCMGMRSLNLPVLMILAIYEQLLPNYELWDFEENDEDLIVDEFYGVGTFKAWEIAKLIKHTSASVSPDVKLIEC